MKKLLCVLLFHSAILFLNCCLKNQSDKFFAAKKLRKSKHECALKKQKTQAG